MHLYTIKQISRAVGVSTDMIRFYEKMGLLNPKRDPNNNYRLYTFEDCKTIIMIKIYTNLGISLKTCQAMFCEHRMNKGVDQLKAHVEKLKHERHFIDKRIEVSSQMLQSLNEYQSDIKYHIYQRQPIIIYPSNLSEYDEIDIDNPISEMYDDYPIYSYYFRIKKELFIDQNITIYPNDIGIMAYSELKGINRTYEVIPKKKVLRTWIEKKKEVPLLREHLNDIFAIINDNGFIVKGDVFFSQLQPRAKSDFEYDVLICEISIE